MIDLATPTVISADLAFRADADADISVLLLDESGRCRRDEDFVFYNAPVSPAGAVRIEAISTVRQRATVDLDLLSDEGVTRFAVAVSAAIGIDPTVADLQIATIDGRRWSIPAPAESGLPAFIAVEIYRRANSWRLRGLAQGWFDGLAGLARSFGIDVA